MRTVVTTHLMILAIILVCEPKKSKIPFKWTSEAHLLTKEVPVVLSSSESVMWPKRVTVIGFGTNKLFDQVTQLHINHFVWKSRYHAKSTTTLIIIVIAWQLGRKWRSILGWCRGTRIWVGSWDWRTIGNTGLLTLCRCGSLVAMSSVNEIAFSFWKLLII